MEGGAHVIMEAVVSGTPVLASHIAGNIGMLGLDYAGYFPCGDGPALARLIRRCQDRQAGNPLLDALITQCGQRAPLFYPAAERAVLHGLVDELLEN